MEWVTEKTVLATWTLDELMLGRNAADGGDWSNSPPTNATIIYKIGIYGWRKRCLYVFLLLLLVTIIINMALTIWIIRVMDFSMHGMGQLRVVDTGVRVEGDSEFLETLSAAHVKSRPDSPLYLQSSRNITLTARDSDDIVVNKLILGDKKVETYAKKFIVRDTKGKLLFQADENHVHLGAPKLSVEGSGGATFKGSVQTPRVRSEASELRLESPTRTLEVRGPEGVNIVSPAGSVTVDSKDSLRIQATKQIVLDARTINLKNIEQSSPGFNGSPYPDVFQLCICAGSGKLFLSPSRGNCQATSDVCS